MFFKILGTFVLLINLVGSLGAQCTCVIYEEEVPPAVLGMNTTDPGFQSQYWAWDDFNNRRAGVAEVLASDVDFGLRVIEIDWLNATVCSNGGVVERTAILFESLGENGFGRWALLNLGVNAVGNIDIDAIQGRLGLISSLATDVPATRIEHIEIGDEAVVVDLAWDLDLAGELLSDLVDEQGNPLPSVRGFAIYVINGPAATARPWDWSRGYDLGVDAVNGYSTDTSATIELPRSLWNGVVVSFAVAPTFDGDGDADGERPESRSVHGSYLGEPSRWIGLPPFGDDQLAAIEDFDAELHFGGVLEVNWSAESEIPNTFYRLWADCENGPSRVIATVDGGAGPYVEFVGFPVCGPGAAVARLEMVDRWGRVLDTEEEIVRRAIRYTGASLDRSSCGAPGRRDG